MLRAERLDMNQEASHFSKTMLQIIDGASMGGVEILWERGDQEGQNAAYHLSHGRYDREIHIRRAN